MWARAGTRDSRRGAGKDGSAPRRRQFPCPYDHFFGVAVFADAGVTEFWAHENCAAAIEEGGDRQGRMVGGLEPEMSAGAGDNVELVVPNALVKNQPVLEDLDGLTAILFHLGRRHTDGDLPVGTPLLRSGVRRRRVAPSYAYSRFRESAQLGCQARCLRQPAKHPARRPGVPERPCPR